MQYQDHQLTIQCIPTKTRTLKLFTMYSPVNLVEFPPLVLYRELGLSDEQFAMDVLMALKDTKKGKQQLLNTITKHWKSYPMHDGDVLLCHVDSFLQCVTRELLFFKLYQNNVLPFNALWFEGNDTLVFFRVDTTDV